MGARMAVKGLADELTSWLNAIDQERERQFRRNNSGLVEWLVIRVPPRAKLSMDASKKHARGHIHLDYGGAANHLASYAIDTGERIIGDKGREYDSAVRRLILQHRDDLQDLWNRGQAGTLDRDIINALKAGTYFNRPKIKAENKEAVQNPPTTPNESKK